VLYFGVQPFYQPQLPTMTAVGENNSSFRTQRSPNMTNLAVVNLSGVGARHSTPLRVRS